jgi:flavin-dependent dehydrogenase
MTYDVVITGAGLAGLTLARQLMLYTSKSVLLLDTRPEVPGRTQKVGESLVQLSGFYFSKVLDLEEHLLLNHYLKYNLRFYWAPHTGSNRNFEEYGASFVRSISNIPTFQLDRNLIESHLMLLNRANPRFTFHGGVRNLEIEISEQGDHRVSYSGNQVTSRWVVDTSGRSGFLKRKFDLKQENAIRHGSTWCWVDGLVNIEKLTDRPWLQVINNPERRKLGHLPFFLATTHFCDEGQWFWVIPLHGKTSLGLVYDHRVIKPEQVPNARKMLSYVCENWPLFARDLPNRQVVDEGRLLDYAYDARQTISSARWGISGVAGRFTDPLYSPGSDSIAIHNTLLFDAIQTDDRNALERKCRLYEQIMRAMYEAYVPSYATSYDCLGDQEAFSLKYAWELAVYFGFYVMPFINNLFTDERFMAAHLRNFGVLGAINRNLHQFLSDFYQWKKASGVRTEPGLVELYDFTPLRESERLFYYSGLGHGEAEAAVEAQLERMKEFARYILTHVHAVVLADRKVLRNASFISSLKLKNTAFDPQVMRENWARHAAGTDVYAWNLNPFALKANLQVQEAEIGVCV